MKLLVLAHTPPPLHGQSVMVQALVEGLARPGLALHHVDFRLSRDHADIGRWSARKMARSVHCAFRAIGVRLRRGCDTLYYVPAPPGKRGALLRDWLVLTLCRPFFRRLVLHWHAAGLGPWLATEATGIERAVTRACLGRADLAVVLSEALRADAEFLGARQTAVVPNGLADPGPPPTNRASGGPWQSLFLGLCSEEKGLFAAAEAVLEANRRSGAPPDAPAFTLVAAGAFPDAATAARFETLASRHAAVLRFAGFAAGPQKRALFASSDCLLFPTHYAAEGFPLVALEALAHDRPVIATRWRALPDIVAPAVGRLVPVDAPGALAEALAELRAHPPASGVCRAHFLAHFGLSQHLERLAAALARLDAHRLA